VYNDLRALLAIDQFRENSKVDAKVAVSMRASGYSRKEILLAILHGAGQASKDGRNWRRYAERVADFAFGLAGEIALAENRSLLQTQLSRKQNWNLVYRISPKI